MSLIFFSSRKILFYPNPPGIDQTSPNFNEEISEKMVSNLKKVFSYVEMKLCWS